MKGLFIEGVRRCVKALACWSHVVMSAVLACNIAYAQGVPAGRGAVSLEHDADGALTKITDGLGHMTDHEYDSLGRLKATTLPTPLPDKPRGHIGYQYAPSNVTSVVTDPRKLDTRSPSNGLGEVQSLNSPDTGLTKFTYYNDGKLFTSTDARNFTTTYTYDNARRLSLISYASGKPTTFEYDGGSNPPNANAIGKLSKVTDESGWTKYEYDGFGRLKSKKQVVQLGQQPHEFITNYTWGKDAECPGKLSSMQLPSGVVINFRYFYSTYCTLDELVANPLLADGSGPDLSQEVLLIENLDWVPKGDDPTNLRLRSWRWGKSGGAADPRKDSEGGFGVSADMGPNTGFQYFKRRTFYDDAGRPTNIEYWTTKSKRDVSKDQAFIFDGEGHLIEQALTSITYGYQYDPNGNRTQKTIGAQPFANTIYADSNKLQASTDVDGTRNYDYEASGQIKSDGVLKFAYSARGRMSSVTTPSGVTKYLYNGFDQRVVKTGFGGTHYFVYDEIGHVVGEYDANGKALYEVVYAGDAPVNVITFSGTNKIKTVVGNIYTDHLDTPRRIMQMVRVDGADVYKTRWRWDHGEAFGNYPPEEDPEGAGPFVFNLRFPGQVYDKESGLVYNHHRDYSNKLGRYVQSDPIGLEGGINTFAYADGNPLAKTDPSGQSAGTLVIVGVPIAIGGGIACNASPICKKKLQEGLQALAKACDRLFSKGDVDVPPEVGPGPNSKDSIPAGPSERPTKEQQRDINEIGDRDGCHTCGTDDPGTKSGDWVGDHQPPNKLNPEGNPQRYYPQCRPCSNQQGGRVRWLPPTL